MENIIEFGDNREIMKRWAQMGVKIQTCVTSPPYYGLRDYGTGQWTGGDPNCDHVEIFSKHGGQRADRDQTSQIFQYTDVCSKCGAVREDKQLGLEETPEEYIANMVDVFSHVRDILSDDGTLWVNIGDSYASSPPGNKTVGVSSKSGLNGVNGSSGTYRETLAAGHATKRDTSNLPGIKQKDLIGIPWMLAFALRADGWYLRQDIIWSKPNPMPESVRDRCTKAHEYIFLLSKSDRYYFDTDSIKEPSITKIGDSKIKFGGNKYGDNDDPKYATKSGNTYVDSGFRNKRSVWTVNTKPYKGAHFATFPTELIEPCILAGARVGDIVFDPFMGSGTTAQVALQNNRKYLGCELNQEYSSLQEERIDFARKNKKIVVESDGSFGNGLFTFE